MKRIIMVFLSLVIIVLCCSCDSTEHNTYDGKWYSVDNAYLYEFSNGEIFCSESYFTLEDGRKISGAYDTCDGYINAFIIGVGGFESTKPLYIVEVDGMEALSDSLDNSGRVYFYRDQTTAQKIYTNNQEALDEWLTNQQEQPVTIDPSKAETVSYDSIVAGDHANKIVALEGIISSYEYDELMEMYSFDLWFWSDDNNKYIAEYMWLFFENDHSAETIASLKDYDDGDKIKLVVSVYGDNSFGSSSYISSELLKKGELCDYGIEIESTPQVNTEPPDDTERYVYITDSGSKYHAAACRMLHDSKIRILYSDAIEQGYTPCDICNPMP